MEKLNFSWLIDAEIAGHSAPTTMDDIGFLKAKGVKALVRLLEPYKTKINSTQINASGLLDFHEPVADFTAPTQSQIDIIIAFMAKAVLEGMPVGVSCGAGIGRTGTILACYLVSKSYTSGEAIQEVKRRRGAEIETPEQKEAVALYYNRLKTGE